MGKSQERDQEIKEFWGFIIRTGKTTDSLNKRREYDFLLCKDYLAIV